MTCLFPEMAGVFSIPDTPVSQLHLSTQLEKLQEASFIPGSCAGHLEILNSTRYTSQLHDVQCRGRGGTSTLTCHCMSNVVRTRTKTVTMFLSGSPRQVLGPALYKLESFHPWVPVKEVYYCPHFKVE